MEKLIKYKNMEKYNIRNMEKLIKYKNMEK